MSFLVSTETSSVNSIRARLGPCAPCTRALAAQQLQRAERVGVPSARGAYFSFLQNGLPVLQPCGEGRSEVVHAPPLPVFRYIYLCVQCRVREPVTTWRSFWPSMLNQQCVRIRQYATDIMEAAPTLRQEMALICVLLATYVAREFVVVHFYNLYSLWTSDVGANTGDLSLILSLGTLTGIVFKLVFGALADSPYVGGKSVY